MRLGALAALAAGLLAAAVPARGATGCAGAVPWRAAASVAGRTATVRGPVVGSAWSSRTAGQPAFLDVGAAYPDPGRFTVVVWGDRRAAFGGSPETRYRGATICVTGSVRLYRGIPEIVATSPAQIVVAVSPPPVAAGSGTIARVVDGDTVELADGRRVRLVQIDTPEVYGTPECYGAAASALAKALLPRGTRVRLVAEPATDAVDAYGRLLRYVFRARDGLDVNLRLVAEGAAAPYYYHGRRGTLAARLDALAAHARAARLGLWGACPRTPYDPSHGVATAR